MTPSQQRRQWLWPALLVAAGYALTLHVFYPGIMNYDARYVHQDSLKGAYGDWQSPVMTWLWAAIDPLAPGSASMFLLLVSTYWLGILLLAIALAKRSRLSSIALCLLALSPPLFALLGVIWRDVLLAAVWMLAAAIIYAVRDASRGTRIVSQIIGLALIMLGVLLRPNALAAAPLLVVFALWPVRVYLMRTLLLFVPVMLMLFGLVQVVYYGMLDAKRQNPLHSIMVFDLGGVTHFSGQNQFPVDWTADENRALVTRCYDPSIWNGYWNGDCKFVMAKIEHEEALFGTPALASAWIKAITSKPTAYLQHRFSFFWRFIAGQNLGMWTEDIERPNHHVFEDRPAFTLLRQIHDALQPTPLFRIWFWLALNIAACLLALRRWRTPDGTFVIAVSGSAILYVLSFLPLGVAAEFRYGYWAVLAAIAGMTVALVPPPAGRATVAGPPPRRDRDMTELAIDPPASRLEAWLRGFGIRQLRLVTGVVLFAFLVSHFLNHALGNLSLETMESALITHNRIWQGQPVKAIFYLSALIHTALGVWMLYERRQFAWSWSEGLQLVLGLSIPALIVAHVADARLAYTLYGHEKYYAQLFYLYGVSRPGMALVQYTVLIVSWVHGCIGLYFWLSLKKWFRPVAPFLLALAVLLPALAALGLFQGARAVKQLQLSEAWRAEHLAPKHVGQPEQRAALDTITNAFLLGYAALLALTLGARGVRALADRRGGSIRLSYGNSKTVRVPRDLTVLEASLRHNIAHASACGGRARCSTCRIRILGDLTPLPPPSRREAFVLERIGVKQDPSIRLACQLRPGCDLSFVQLLQTGATSAARAGHLARNGQERYLVSMFVDMRGSTTLAETRLPFDTVFIINRFLAAVSQAVVAAGGEPNQFVGDGQLALFGLAADPQTACRQAIEAAALIAQNIAELNALLCSDLAEPLCFGIGIHGGEVIVGDIGSPGHVVFTALGDPVNVTARLQDMTKTLGCEVILSDEVRRTADLPDDCLPLTKVIIRGRNEPILVRAAQAAELATIVGGAKPALT